MMKATPWILEDTCFFFKDTTMTKCQRSLFAYAVLP